MVKAFTGLAETSERIDTTRLAEALNVLADNTRLAPADFRSALEGVSRLSQNIAARDTQLNTLLTNLGKVSTVLGDRSGDIVALMNKGNVLFQALVQRKDAIHNLLVATSQLSAQLTGLVQDTRADLKPALDNLYGVVQLLQDNQDNLDQSMRLLAPYYRAISSTTGNGPWIDVWIQNLAPVPSPGGHR